MTDERLTSVDYWRDNFWKVADQELPSVVLDKNHLEYRPFQQIFEKYFSKSDGRRCLEIGCTPGRYLWYFWKEFGYEPHGLEYVPEAAELSSAALAAAGVPATIHTGDLFDFSVPDDERYELVFSFGLVEHFTDIVPAVEHHARLVAPGGTLLICVPNHRGLNGWLLRAIQPEVYRTHNRMGWKMLKQAVERLDEFELLTGGYWCHFNLAPSNFLPWLRDTAPYPIFRAAEILHILALRYCFWLPNNWLTAPYIGVIAKRRSTTVSEPSDA